MPPPFDGYILIVEDEPSIADTLTIALEMDGFATRVVSTGQECLDLVSENPSVFVVLDVGLPDQSGFDVLRSLRASHNVPVLMLTARAEEIDRVLGLELGADDYVTKPFSPREVSSRIKAILRRWNMASETPSVPSNSRSSAGAVPAVPATSELAGSAMPMPAETDASQSSEGRFGDFQWNDETKRILYREKSLELSPYEYGTLRLLLQRPGMVFSREAIMERVWSEPEDSFDRAVDTVIKNIRNAIRKVDQEADPIETRRGLGYCLRVS